MARRTSAMEEIAAGADDARRPVPLDLAELVAPYVRRRKLSIRLEQVPTNAELSRGVLSDAGVWSLNRDEIDGLTYTPPDGLDEPHTIVVRIISFDNDTATTLAVHKYSIEPGAGAGAGDDADETGTPASEVAAAEGTAGAAEQDAVKRLETVNAFLQAENEQRLADAVVTAKTEIQEALGDLLQRVEAANARADTAEKAAEEAAAALAASADGAAVAPDAGHGRAELEAELAELKQTVADIEARHAGDLKEAQKTIQASADEVHAKEIARLRDFHARTLEQELAGQEQRLRQELDTQHAAQRAAWQSETDTRIEEAVRKAAQDAESQAKQPEGDVARTLADLIERAERAETALEDNRAETEANLTAAIEPLRNELAVTKAKLDAAERGLADATKAHERDLAEKIEKAKAAQERELTERIKEAAGKAVQAAETRLKIAEEAFGRALVEVTERAEQAETSLAAAESAARAKTEGELAQLRDELSSAKATLATRESEFEAALREAEATLATRESEFEATLREAEARLTLAQGDSRRALVEMTVRAERAEAALGDAQGTGESELQGELLQLRDELSTARMSLATREAELEIARRSPAGQGGDDVAAAVREAVREVEARLVDAIARAERAEAALDQARSRPNSGNEGELHQLREDLSAARAMVAVRDKAFDDARVAYDRELLERVESAEKKARRESEAELKRAHESWEAEAEAKLAKRQKEWEAGEASRLAAARIEWREQARIEGRKRTTSNYKRRQGRAAIGRRAARYAIIGACLIGAFYLYPRIEPLIQGRLIPGLAELWTKAQPMVETAETRVRELIANKPVASGNGNVDGYVVAVDSVNIRTAPAVGAPAVTTLKRGTAVKAIGSRGEWLRVSVGLGGKPATSGWVHRSMLQRASTAATKP